MARCPHKNRMFLEESCKRKSNDGKVFYELPVTAGKAQETPEFFSICRSGPASYSVDFRIVSGDPSELTIWPR
jgi:hypothetical protein